MMRPLSVVAALTIVFACSVRPASADETCPGCLGNGKVGCTACAKPFSIFFVGECSRCRGFYAFMHKGRCTLCNDTGKCHRCRGQGMDCMVCKGTGRVPDGTAAAVAKRQKQASLDAMKRLAILDGSWQSEGREGDKKYSSEFRWEPCVEGTFLRLTERMRYEGGDAVDLAGTLTYDPQQQCYVLNAFFSEGGSARLTGRMDEKADVLTFSTSNDAGREVRIVWRLDPGQRRVEYCTEVRGDEGFERIGEGSGRRVGNASEFAPRESGLSEPLQHFGSLLGSWSAEESDDQGKKISSSRFRWESCAGGSWLRSREEFSRSDGTAGDCVAMLGYDSESKTYLYLLYLAPGRTLVFKGEAGETEGMFVFTGNGLRWSWTILPDPGRCEAVVESDQGEGGFKLVSKSKAVKADR